MDMKYVLGSGLVEMLLRSILAILRVTGECIVHNSSEFKK